MLDVEEICGEGGEMVGVVPLPRRSLVFCKTTSREVNAANTTHSLIVVMENPSKTLDVVCCDPEMNFSSQLTRVKLDKHTFA